MNREIKFRVWTGSVMEYNVVVGKFGAFYVNPGPRGDGLDEKDSACLTPFNTIYSKETSVMQYTGLKDKNGKDIYEGDICHAYKANSYLNGKYEVVWDNKKCRFGYKDGNRIKHNQIGCGGNLQCIVIGNIHQQPQLIK